MYVCISTTHQYHCTIIFSALCNANVQLTGLNTLHINTKREQHLLYIVFVHSCMSCAWFPYSRLLFSPLALLLNLWKLFWQVPIDQMTRSLILALSVCYYARLQDRTQYEKQICRAFQYPLSLPDGVRSFREEIQWYVDSHVRTYHVCIYLSITSIITLEHLYVHMYL